MPLICANGIPAGKAIAGNKQKNDPLDAESIAHLMRSSLFPQAYPYPGEMRAARDLLRSRQRLLRQRSEAYTPVQLLLRQQGTCDFRGKDVKRVSGKEQTLHFRSINRVSAFS